MGVEEIRRTGDYAALQGVLDMAYTQSAEGKGKARHANDRAFDQQPILEIGRMVGPGFATGQVMKKAQEATSMAARGEAEAAVAELLGAIVYAASAVVLIQETGRRPEGASAPCAERLIEPEVVEAVEAPAARPFKVGDKVNVRGRETDGNPGILVDHYFGEWDIHWSTGVQTWFVWSEDRLVHVD